MKNNINSKQNLLFDNHNIIININLYIIFNFFHYKLSNLKNL